jgi:hypothetical protein
VTPESNLLFDRRLNRTMGILIAAGSVALMLFATLGEALSFVSGGLLSLINFHWLKNAVDFIVMHGAQGGIGKRVALQYAGRYALIALILYATIRVSVLDVICVFAGMLVYVAAVLLESVWEIGKTLIRDYRNGRTYPRDRRVD